MAWACDERGGLCRKEGRGVWEVQVEERKADKEVVGQC